MLLPDELIPQRKHAWALHDQGVQHWWRPPQGQGMERSPQATTLDMTFQEEKQRSCAWDWVRKFLQVFSLFLMWSLVSLPLPYSLTKSTFYKTENILENHMLKGILGPDLQPERRPLPASDSPRWKVLNTVDMLRFFFYRRIPYTLLCRVAEPSAVVGNPTKHWRFEWKLFCSCTVYFYSNMKNKGESRSLSTEKSAFSIMLLILSVPF